MNYNLGRLNTNPLVSIIIPSYNQGKYIKQTIDSILDQNYRPIEVIIVDGASQDETIDVLHAFDNIPEIKWFSEPDSGVVEAVNKGLSLAHGEIGAIQSSDDFYLPHAIKTAVMAFKSEPKLGLIFGDIIKIDPVGNEILRTNFDNYSLEKLLSSQIWIPQPSTFFRINIAKYVGFWREEVPYAADTDFWLRILLYSNAKKIDNLLAKRRMHAAQRDSQGDRIINDYKKTINDFFNKFNAPKYLLKPAEAGILLKQNRYFYHEPQKIKIDRMNKAVSIYPQLKHALFPDKYNLKKLLKTFYKSTEFLLNMFYKTNVTLRQLIGFLIFDLLNVLDALIKKNRWITAKNRFNNLKKHNGGIDTSSIGSWSEDIYACSLFPIFGKLLMIRALDQWPVEFNFKNRRISKPDLSFIIPFRGKDRLPLLSATLLTILSQKCADIECIIVEQSIEQVIKDLPNNIRYIHLPNEKNRNWNKSLAYNVGVSAASSEIVVCHDSDLLVPTDYSYEILRRFKKSFFDVLYLYRFKFYLTELCTYHILNLHQIPSKYSPLKVRQNWQGGTFAIKKKAFFDIGGFDERFVGWGGEDNEFYDRCKLLNAYRFGYLPFFHLWHLPQSTKIHSLENPNLKLLSSLLKIPAQQRVNYLLKHQPLKI